MAKSILPQWKASFISISIINELGQKNRKNNTENRELHVLWKAFKFRAYRIDFRIWILNENFLDLSQHRQNQLENGANWEEKFQQQFFNSFAFFLVTDRLMKVGEAKCSGDCVMCCEKNSKVLSNFYINK